MDPGVYLAIAAAIAGPIGAYLLAAKRLSGSIKSSEASDLWKESASLREDLMSRIRTLNGTIENCEKRIEELEARNQKLWLENGTQRQMVEDQGDLIHELRDQVQRLNKDKDQLKDENQLLRRRVTELELELHG